MHKVSGPVLPYYIQIYYYIDDQLFFKKLSVSGKGKDVEDLRTNIHLQWKSFSTFTKFS